MRPLLAVAASFALLLPAISDDAKKPAEKLLSPAFDDSTLSDVLEWLNREGGFEYTLTKEAQKIAKHGTVAVKLVATDVTAREALKEVLQSLGLDFAEKIAGQIRIMTHDEYTKEIVLELYDIRDLITPVTDFDGPEVKGWDGPAGVRLGEPDQKIDDQGARQEHPQKSSLEEPEKLPAVIKSSTGGAAAWTEGMTVSLSNGILYVKAPQALQMKVRDLLEKFRRLK